jgi:hypothetical protein
VVEAGRQNDFRENSGLLIGHKRGIRHHGLAVQERTEIKSVRPGNQFYVIQAQEETQSHINNEFVSVNLQNIVNATFLWDTGQTMDKMDF